jgi:hypothetical protein
MRNWMRKIIFACLVLMDNLSAQSADMTDYATICVSGASFMDFRGDIGKVATYCKECLYTMPMQIDKTDDNMIDGTQQCITKYIESRKSKK